MARKFNQYAVILVNPDKHPQVQKELGQMFIDWLISPEGQKAIADYSISTASSCFFRTPPTPTPKKAVKARRRRATPNVRFGSKADVSSAKRHVRFTPKATLNATYGISALGKQWTSPARY